MRFFGRSLVGLLLLALTLGLLAMAAVVIRDSIEAKLSGGGNAPPARERVFAANVVIATAIETAPVITTFGEIRSRRTLELRAPQAGKVIELAPEFQDGAAVKSGQMLLRIDPADATAGRDIAYADMDRAKAELREAEKALILAGDDLAAAQTQADLRNQAVDRQRDLQQRGVGSAAAVETTALAASSAAQAVLSRRSALAQVEARVDQGRTAVSRQAITVAEAERALQDTELFAAFDGVLSGVKTVPGRLLSNNESLGELIDPTALEVAFRLSTAQFARLIDGNGTMLPAEISAVLEVSGAELLATGRLERVGAAVGEGQSGRQVFATLTNVGGFRPGDFVSVRIAEPLLRNVVVLPATALGANNSVLALADGERLEEIQVTLLRRQGDHILVEGQGIAGRELVSERSPLLGAGIKVKPIRTEDTGGQVAAAPAPATPEMVELTAERRAQLVAFVEGNNRMPDEAKARILSQLTQDKVPAQVIERLESRMGG
jgi:multidrug resistance efflux pump